MTSETGQQITATKVLSNIPRSKGGLAMKIGHLIIFFRNHAENETGRLFQNLFLFYKKDLYRVKACGLDLNFNIFW